VEEFDYVIVGAGAAGCAMAHRLSESGKNTVALVEAGGKDSIPSGPANPAPIPRRRSGNTYAATNMIAEKATDLIPAT
jgi:choline dehydrogenase-like flavoprotein